MQGIPVYILAGGRSSRFGSDKARATIEGRTLIQRVEAMVQPIAAQVTVVADRADRYADLGLRTIADRVPGLGPVGGLWSALHDQSITTPTSEVLLLCPCDALTLKIEWLETLRAAATTLRRGDAVVGAEGDATVHALAAAFRGHDRWQPMPAMYHRDAVDEVRAALDADRRSMQALLDRLRAIALPLPADWPSTWQANSREELAAFVAATTDRRA